VGTTVDVQGLTRDKSGIVGCQKYGSSGDLFRLRHAAKRDAACTLDELRFAAAKARLRCVGEPRRDPIDPDAIGGRAPSPASATGCRPCSPRNALLEANRA